MQLLDGKLISKEIKKEIAAEVESYKSKGLRAPNLAAVLVGEDPASQYYVKSKLKSCEQVGFDSNNIILESSTSEEDLLILIDKLNKDEGIDGYIIQLPLPDHINSDKVLQAVAPKKDVDGFHPENLGKLVLGLDTFVPATPLGILELIKRYDIPTASKNVCVLGRSNIVGKPISIILSQKAYPGNATVTLLHSKSKDLEAKLAEADIIVAAIGKPLFVKENMVKKGAVVIDVGINRIEDKTRKNGYRMVGDVDFDNVAPKCSYITPVPGGVGLMTVSSLLMNTLKAYKRKYERK